MGVILGDSSFRELEGRLNALQEEIAELILLEETPVAVSAYSLSYEEYMEIEGDRL